MDSVLEKKINVIAELIKMAKSDKELVLLLDDVLTESELDKVYERVQIVYHLMDDMSQRDVAKLTGAGIATVTRGASLMRKPNFILSKFIEKMSKGSGWR